MLRGVPTKTFPFILLSSPSHNNNTMKSRSSSNPIHSLLSFQKYKSAPPFQYTNPSRHNYSTQPLSNRIFPENLLQRTQFIHSENGLKKLLSSVNNSKSLQKRHEEAKKTRKSRTQKISSRLEKEKRNRDRRMGLLQDLANSSESTPHLVEKIYPKSLYASYLYLKLLREQHRFDIGLEYLQETFFNVWMDIRSDICMELIQNEHGAGSTPGTSVPTSEEYELFKTHQVLLFTECLKHLVHHEEASEKVLEFLKLFDNDVQDELAQHQLFESEEVWAQLFYCCSTLEAPTSLLNEHVKGLWNQYRQQCNDTKQSYFARVSTTQLLYRFLIYVQQPEEACKLAIDETQNNPSQTLSHMVALFSELLRLPHEQHSTLIRDCYEQLKDNSHFAQHPTILSMTFQAVIDAGDESQIDLFFRSNILPSLERNVLFSMDNFQLLMPLCFRYVEAEEWSNLTALLEKYILVAPPSSEDSAARKVTLSETIHPDLLYLAALSYNKQQKYESTVNLHKTYKKRQQNWKCVVEYIAAYGKLQQFDICESLVNEYARDVSRIEENAEILARLMQSLMEGEEAQVARTTELISIHTAKHQSKVHGVAYVPRGVTVVLPVLRNTIVWDGDFSRIETSVSVMLEMLNEMWPIPIFDPKPLVHFLNQVDDALKEAGASANTSSHHSASIRHIQERLLKEREAFLRGENVEEFLVSKRL